jgi:hypothetical protein
MLGPAASHGRLMQTATAAYNGLQAVWELPTAEAVAAANRFMSYANVSTILVRLGG